VIARTALLLISIVSATVSTAALLIALAWAEVSPWSECLLAEQPYMPSWCGKENLYDLGLWLGCFVVSFFGLSWMKKNW
jgi:hypothetical protein